MAADQKIAIPSACFIGNSLQVRRIGKVMEWAFAKAIEVKGTDMITQ